MVRVGGGSNAAFLNELWNTCQCCAVIEALHAAALEPSEPFTSCSGSARQSTWGIRLPGCCSSSFKACHAGAAQTSTILAPGMPGVLCQLEKLGKHPVLQTLIFTWGSPAESAARCQQSRRIRSHVVAALSAASRLQWLQGGKIIDTDLSWTAWLCTILVLLGHAPARNMQGVSILSCSKFQGRHQHAQSFASMSNHSHAGLLHPAFFVCSGAAHRHVYMQRHPVAWAWMSWQVCCTLSVHHNIGVWRCL